MGHVISSQGVSVDETKVQVVSDWLKPFRGVISTTPLRGFLSLSCFYSRFIKNYGIIAGPLTNLLQKQSFKWSSEAEAAFISLKQALYSAPVLQLPDFSTQFVVECDASGRGIGAVIHQNDHLITIYSKKLADRHLKLPAYERELIGLSQAIRN
nr:Transposon Ty3-G Gag-Pol polyprotein [Ipomoea batatas]